MTDGFVNIISYASIGCLPLLFFSLTAVMVTEVSEVYSMTLVAAAVLAFLLGASKSRFVANSSLSYLGTEAVIVLAVCAVVAFSVGKAVSNHFLLS